jgi:small GTP-binding protein
VLCMYVCTCKIEAWSLRPLQVQVLFSYYLTLYNTSTVPRGAADTLHLLTFCRMLRVASFAAVESCRAAAAAAVPKGCPPFRRNLLSLHGRFLSTAAASEAPSSTEKPLERGPLSLLTLEERDLLTQQRALMQQARDVTNAVGSVSIKDFTGTFLDNVVDETTFTIVVAGEFNAGKSTLINALLGKKILESGPLPTTDSITIITHQKADDREQIQQPQRERRTVANDTFASPSRTGGVVVHQVPNVPLLQDLTLIDTPGTNAVLADHTARTLRLLPTADLILFVTSADRPFPESEKALLASIQTFRKSIVVVVNKMDILETSGGSYGMEEKQRVVDFVTHHAADLLGGRPMVIPVSSRDALSAKVMGRKTTTPNKSTSTNISGSVWERSNFHALESFLKDSLTMETKIKTKLTNPIGQIEGMVTASLASVRKEQADLELDIATIKLLQTQYAAWRKEMDGQMLDFRKDVTTLLQTEGNRCSVLLNRWRILKFYQSAIQESKALKAEYDTTRPHFSSRKSLEADLLEHVRETA